MLITIFNLFPTFTAFNAISSVVSHIVTYPAPLSLNYSNSLGVVLVVCMYCLILSGWFLAMFLFTENFTGLPNSFASLLVLHRDVCWGFMLRSFHAIGVAIFFVCLYLHLARSLFFGYGITSFSTYYSGAIMFVGFFAIAFLGYSLIMGSMSLWAVIVIVSFFNMFPSVVQLAFGGFVPASYVLGRFFVLHFLLPHIMLVVFAIHVLLLHNSSSGSGTSAAFASSSTSLSGFAPLHLFKHCFVLVLFFAAYLVLMCFFPYTLAHPLAAVPPSLLVTPSHIVPEFYFLPFYGVLKAIPSFNAGLLMFVSLLLSCIHLRHSIVHAVASVGTHTSSRVSMYPLCLIFCLAFLMLAFLGSAITTAVILGYSRVLILLIIILTLNNPTNPSSIML